MPTNLRHQTQTFQACCHINNHTCHASSHRSGCKVCLKSSAPRCMFSLPQQAILSAQDDPTQGFTARAQAALVRCLTAAQEAQAHGAVLTAALGPAWRQPGQAVRLCLELLPGGGPEEGLRWGLKALLLPACQAVQAAPCRTLMEGLKAAGGGPDLSRCADCEEGPRGRRWGAQPSGCAGVPLQGKCR